MRRILLLVTIAGVWLWSSGSAQTRALQPTYVIVTSDPADRGAATAAETATLKAWSDAVDGRVQRGELQRVAGETDSLVRGRTHDRYRQIHRGVPVFGGDLVRQYDGQGRTLSLFGALYPDIEIETTPVISQEDATVLLARAGRGTPFADAATELVVLPHDRRYELTWNSRILSEENGHVYRIFLDAITGNELFRYDDTQTQGASVGVGRGIADDPLKVSGQAASGGFRAVDMLTPGQNTTYDMKGDPVRATAALNGTRPLVDADIAIDSDNLWGDPAVVSTHSYATLTYLYYFTKFQRRGINNNNLKYRLLVNPARIQDLSALSGQYPLFFSNAAYYGSGYMAFGVGSTANRNFAASIDVVAHEITHGVTSFSSGLIYLNESGALNESFSDMMGVAIEFEFQPRGGGLARAEWLQGEDIRLSGNGLRNFANPQQLGHPDHYSIRFTGTADNGGVHINSSIMNHVFYLAIEGGSHRLGGPVQGVGFQNRFDIERVVYRAFTSMLPSNATFTIARAATLQAARDIHGAGSAAERALEQAWNAVGVQ